MSERKLYCVVRLKEDYQIFSGAILMNAEAAHKYAEEEVLKDPHSKFIVMRSDKTYEGQITINVK